MNEIMNIIKNRRSIRKYNNEPIAKEQLQEIVEAGRWAPTGGNCQSVHFTVITNEQVLEELRTMVKEAFAAMELRDDMYASMKNSIKLSQRGNYVYDYNAPVLVVVSNCKGYPNAIADSACALENMMLAATSLNIGSCWINQLHWLEHEPELRDYLSQHGIESDEVICGALALGNYDESYKQIERKGMKVDFIE